MEVNKKPIIDYMSNLINSYKNNNSNWALNHIYWKKNLGKKNFYNKRFLYDKHGAQSFFSQ